MEFRFLNRRQEELDGGRGISALFARDKDGKTLFLGTTFFITRNGLMLTAKHCLFDSKGKSWDSIFIVQILKDKEFVIRPIENSYWNFSDVAVLVPQDLNIENPIPSLTIKILNIGETIASYAYPNSTVFEGEKKTILNLNDVWHSGIIEEFHSDGFLFLKNPCYQSDMYIQGGSSGGPVAENSGSVFAINSTGSDTISGIKPYSLLSPVYLCFDIKINISVNKIKRDYSILELIHLNYIPVMGINK